MLAAISACRISACSVGSACLRVGSISACILSISTCGPISACIFNKTPYIYFLWIFGERDGDKLGGATGDGMGGELEWMGQYWGGICFVQLSYNLHNNQLHSSLHVRHIRRYFSFIMWDREGKAGVGGDGSGQRDGQRYSPGDTTPSDRLQMVQSVPPLGWPLTCCPCGVGPGGGAGGQVRVSHQCLV